MAQATFENLLQIFGSQNPYRKDSYLLSNSGEKAYRKLCSALELLEELNMIDDASSIIEQVDEYLEEENL